jgi:hypothetical protein
VSTAEQVTCRVSQLWVSTAQATEWLNIDCRPCLAAFQLVSKAVRAIGDIGKVRRQAASGMVLSCRGL